MKSAILQQIRRKHPQATLKHLKCERRLWRKKKAKMSIDSFRRLTGIRIIAEIYTQPWLRLTSKNRFNSRIQISNRWCKLLKLEDPPFWITRRVTWAILAENLSALRKPTKKCLRTKNSKTDSRMQADKIKFLDQSKLLFRGKSYHRAATSKLHRIEVARDRIRCPILGLKQIRQLGMTLFRVTSTPPLLNRTILTTPTRPIRKEKVKWRRVRWCQKICEDQWLSFKRRTLKKVRWQLPNWISIRIWEDPLPDKDVPQITSAFLWTKQVTVCWVEVEMELSKIWPKFSRLLNTKKREVVARSMCTKVCPSRPQLQAQCQIRLKDRQFCQQISLKDPNFAKQPTQTR